MSLKTSFKIHGLFGVFCVSQLRIWKVQHFASDSKLCVKVCRGLFVYFLTREKYRKWNYTFHVIHTVAQDKKKEILLVDIDKYMRIQYT